MTRIPKVSIIIPAYRRPDFLNQAVDSIVRQTFTDYEIIVVDDCSGDDVVAQYRLPSTARLIRRTVNSGRASIPRNDGFRASHGEYLAFLDMDDIWLPEKLARQVAALDTHPDAALTFCHFTRVDEALAPLSKQVVLRPVDKNPLAEMITSCFIVSPSLTLIRRSALEAVGGFDEDITGTADWDLWIRLLAVSPFHHDPMPLVLYRQTPGQQSRDQRRMCRGKLVVLQKTRSWARQERRDLLPLLHREIDRRYYEYVKAQCKMHEAPAVILRTIGESIRHAPCSPRVLRNILRLLGHSAARLVRQKRK